MLTGTSINVRSIRNRDLDTLLDLLSDIENQGDFLPATMVSEATFRQRYEHNGLEPEDFERYLITSKSDDILGSIWVFKSVPYYDALEIGYQIFDRAHHGKGYTSEALTLFRDYLFETRQINRLEIRCSTGNPASEKVATKAGFVLEGINREAAFSKGRLHDMKTLALLRREWRSA